MILSVLGLYTADDTIFDTLKLPTGVDKDILVNNLLAECAELEVLYPNPNFMKNMLGVWSAKELVTWESLSKTFDLEYNPIWNVDGTETTIEERDLINSRDLLEEGRNTSKLDGSKTNKVSGFNDAGENVLVESEQDIDDTTTVDDNKVSNKGSVTDKGKITTTHTRGGNIGVTMTQQLLNAELEVRPKLNIYNYIIESFKSRFCLRIY